MRLSSIAKVIGLLAATQFAVAYQVLIQNSDDVRQVCSGMWGSNNDEVGIEVVFAPGSRGQLALVIFEWKDAKYLGVDQSGQASDNQWEDDRVYICTLDALNSSLCDESQLGQFIYSTPADSATNASSIFTASVRFDPVPSAPLSAQDEELGTGPYRYQVAKTGYYCVGAVPLTLDAGSATRNSTAYTGVVDFVNIFDGHLPAAEYPKVGFYLFLTCAYVAVGLVWAVLVWQHRHELLPLQNYISGTIAFLVVEIFSYFAYYEYLNKAGHPGVANALLVLVSVLNAGRNSLSFFLLLITAMGYGIVRPSLGGVMMKVRLLALVHFVFGVLYSLGTVAIPLESAGYFVFFFVFPLSFTLTAFLMWIMWSLNSTIADLANRCQTFKKSMFTKLYRVLVVAVIIIGAFFVLSSLSFSSRLDQDYGPDTWQTRWVLMDGWLGVLYFVVFFSVAWIWRPTANNRRLALSDELPTEEMGEEDYELGGEEDKDGDAIELGQVRRDSVVFDVGEDEEESEEEGRRSGDRFGLGGGGYGSDEERDIGRQGQGKHVRFGSGPEHQALRQEDSDEDEELPRYNRKDD